MPGNQFAAVDRKALDFAFLLYGKFLDKCPDHIWFENFGGRTVGRQFCHAISASGVYLQSFGNTPPDGAFPGAADPFPESASEQDDSFPTPDREEARDLLKRVKAMADAVLLNVNDQELLLQNGPISQFLGGYVTNADVLSIMAGHMLYHLGSCDSALRSGGIPGVFSGLGLVSKILAQNLSQQK